MVSSKRRVPTEYKLCLAGIIGNGKTEHSLMNFLKRQGPNAKYILTVCTGSWILSSTGLLDGKRATTNKETFKVIKVSRTRRLYTSNPASFVGGY